MDDVEGEINQGISAMPFSKFDIDACRFQQSAGFLLKITKTYTSLVIHVNQEVKQYLSFF